MKILRVAFIAILAGILFFSCEKEYSYEGGNVTLADGSWQFQNAIRYNGNIDTAYIQDVSGTKVLTLVGKSLAGGENFRIQLFAADSFTTTSYLASSSEIGFDYFTSSKTIFKGDAQSGEFVVSITSLANNKITGTFSGAVEDSTGAQTAITAGSFTSSINLSSNGSGQGGTQSAGVLGSNPDSCSPIIIFGNFITGTALTSANTVEVQVNITRPGSFIIATNSVNGVNFFKAGTFTDIGVQNVVLEGSGIPQSQGDQVFTVTYGTSNCIFKITFLPGTLPASDYLPLTVTSNWAFSMEGGTPIDSLFMRVSSHSPSFGGNVFSSIIVDDLSIPSTDTFYYRKSGNDYFTYFDFKDYFLFDNPVLAEFVILNDAVPAGTTLQSATFQGTIGGLAASAFIETTILEKGVPETVGGINFSDVIKVRYEYYLTSDTSIPIFTEQRWYAKGVGLVYINLFDALIYNIGRYQVI